MRRDLLSTRGVRLALAALVLSLAVLLWTVVRAVKVEAPAPAATEALASLEGSTRRAAPPPADIQSAVENDLFSPDRSAPESPYRMPGESRGDDAPRAEPMRPMVLGTAVATDGRSFATLQLGDGRPTLVHVGDKIGEWSVRAIERGKVTLLGTGGTRVDVTVPKPGT